MRQSGVLMHITSLPSRGGVGTLGQAAYDFVDFVKASGMSIWQALPIGPTGYAESPYQSSSTFAGNPLMIDFDLLEQEGILPKGSYEPLPIEPRVDFEAVKAQKSELLRLAFDTSRERLSGELAEFEQSHPWVRPYGLFCAVKARFGGVSWMEWPDDGIRLRRSDSVAEYSAFLHEDVDYHVFCQYLFFRQWSALHDYAREKGVTLMGDMPIYVAEDSADVWLNPDLFELDEDCRPIRIAGVPPDYFQKDGQRWGNPLYAWKKHAETGYSWWIGRLRALSELFDILRIDHFIGFANYYAIPASEPTARVGKYEIGPGRKLFKKVKKELPHLRIVAEDLGVVSARVKRLLAWCGYPGMKVMQFAYGGDPKCPDLPEHHTENCIVYTGTHDNNTSLGWWQAAGEKEKAFARKKLGMEKDSDDILPYLLRAAFESVGDTVIVPMQDLLGLGGDARMNFPGTVGGNWLWRMEKVDVSPIARRMRRLNRLTGRGPLRAETPAQRAERLLAEAEDICACQHHTSLHDAAPWQLHSAIAGAAMLDIAPQWADDAASRREGRRALYLSAEYLVGRLIYNNLYAMGILNEVKDGLAQKGVDIRALEDIEDAALGNGGLGRLAACFLDSAATHDIPLDGYGLRYRYGLFKQVFEDCAQKELPDDWTRWGDPWSIRRDELAVTVAMKGLTVTAVPYDMPVIGYDRKSVGTLRLWQCESPTEFDFDLFNRQDYALASRDKNTAEDITKVLYPNDSQAAGKLLRLRQQYVLVSASLQDMLRSAEEAGISPQDFALRHAVQLNDTHPAMAIPEMIRLLAEKGIDFESAFALAQKTFRYTNHTVMREALECWDQKLMAQLSPELLSVIRQIQARLKRELKKAKVEDTGALDILSGGQVRMANLAVYGSSYVNGVAAIHTDILKKDVFREWYALYPERFSNKTNGVTQRRWLGLCNPELTALLRDALGADKFMTDLFALSGLKDLIDDDLAARFISVKREKKRQLAACIREHEGVDIPETFVFDVQVKRLHEYKRQLMNALCILDIYYRIKDGELDDFPATAFIFGAKSAPGYARAKAVIRFINHIAQLVNSDPDMKDRMRVVFVQNYNCSWAERIIPAADLSEQISPAGTEASGTGNMKLMLNGACTVGTFDGANVEIFEAAGAENNYPFGARVEDIEAVKDSYDPKAIYEADRHLKRVVDALADGTFESADAPLVEGELTELKKAILEGASWHRADHYYICLDYASYFDTRLRAIRDAKDETEFAKKALHNIAGAGGFSSDRTVMEYWKELWAK